MIMKIIINKRETDRVLGFLNGELRGLVRVEFGAIGERVPLLASAAGAWCGSAEPTALDT